jgi:hypothetical protein
VAVRRAIFQVKPTYFIHINNHFIPQPKIPKACIAVHNGQQASGVDKSLRGGTPLGFFVKFLK